MKKLGTLFCLCLILAASSAGEGARAAGRRASDEEREIRKLMADNNVPVLGLGVIRGGRLEEVKVFGSLGKGGPAPRDTIFNVASLTKPVVALLALRLVSAGEWSLDEPLDKYWVDPDLKDDPRHKMLTTRIILTHRTGFPNWRWMSASKKLAFEFEPGGRYQYSGEGFEYLRRALEAKFKRPLESMAAEMIFGPLRMRDTRFVWDAGVDEARYAAGYDAKGNAYPLHKTTRANAADDLLTTVEDYAKFVVSVMKGEGLTRGAFAEMTGRHVRIKGDKYFGLGWAIYDNVGAGGEYALEHGGADKGVSTEVFILPKSKQALIIMMNVDEGYRIYDRLLAMYLGEAGRKIVEIEMKSP